MSFLSAAHPLCTAVQTLCCVLVTVLIPHPTVTALSLIGAILSAVMLRTGGRFLAAMIPFAVLVTLTNPLFSHEGATVLFWLFGVPFTAEALAFGANTAVMLTAVMLWCRLAAAVLTADKLLSLGGKRAPRLTLTLCMARRFLPLFTKSLHEARLARRSLGLLSGRGLSRVRQEVTVFSAVTARAFENAVISARSMEARGYTLAGHTVFSPYRRRAADTVVTAVTLTATAAVTVGAAMGGGAMTWYPVIMRSWTAWDTVVTTASAVLMLTPAIFEGEERVRWYRSKG